MSLSDVCVIGFTLLVSRMYVGWVDQSLGLFNRASIMWMCGIVAGGIGGFLLGTSLGKF